MIKLRRIHLASGQSSRKQIEPCVACLGTFDGVHLGHQTLLRRAAQLAASAKIRAALISFYPHPAVVLGRAKKIPKITSLRQRLAQLENLSVNSLLLVRFNRSMAALSASSFVNQILLGELNVQQLVIGPDASVGRERQGTAQVIKGLLEEKGAGCEILAFLQVSGHKVSSRSIREALLLGEIKRARQLLGRPFAVDARVVRGAARGNQLGFKTLNFNPAWQIWPKLGVYATRVRVGAALYPAVTNVGMRPTFGGGEQVMETHLLDYAGNDLYGARVEVFFEEFLRDEMRFSGAQELIAQIHRDVQRAREALKN